MASSGKYERGTRIPAKEIRQVADKKLKGGLKKFEGKMREMEKSAKDSEVLLLEESGYLKAEGLEQTYKVKQSDILKAVDVQTANKSFELSLEYGPYRLDYTRNGRYMLIGGEMGHLAAFDCKTGSLNFEVQLREKIRAVQWLHNETMLAVSQKKHVYIYDKQGLEIHKLAKHRQVNAMEFLPYHFLLSTVGVDGVIRYQDVSTGQLVSELHTKSGPCFNLVQNPQNAVLFSGHTNGTVSLWSPALSTPLVKILCHNGPVSALAVDHSGNYFVSSGLDGQMKIWDSRKFQEVQSYFSYSPSKTLSISQKGLIAVGHGPNVTIWKDAFQSKQQSPFMRCLFESESVKCVQFCPFEDFLGVSYNGGISTLVIPGSGEPNFDALEFNPYESVRQRQEGEVRRLLEKIQPDTISLDTDVVGTVATSQQDLASRRNLLLQEANSRPIKEKKEKNKARGRSSAKARYLRKRKNVIGLERSSSETGKVGIEGNQDKELIRDPLNRFIKEKLY